MAVVSRQEPAGFGTLDCILALFLLAILLTLSLPSFRAQLQLFKTTQAARFQDASAERVFTEISLRLQQSTKVPCLAHYHINVKNNSLTFLHVRPDTLRSRYEPPTSRCTKLGEDTHWVGIGVDGVSILEPHARLNQCQSAIGQRFQASKSLNNSMGSPFHNPEVHYLTFVAIADLGTVSLAQNDAVYYESFLSTLRQPLAYNITSMHLSSASPSEVSVELHTEFGNSHKAYRKHFGLPMQQKRSACLELVA